MEPLASFPWVQVGSVAGLVGLLVVSLIRGWLWTGSSVDKVIDQMEKRIKEKEETNAELRRANAALDARNDLLAEQLREMMEVGRTSAAALNALPRAG